jgi:hypothetical protein
LSHPCGKSRLASQPCGKSRLANARIVLTDTGPDTRHSPSLPIQALLHGPKRHPERGLAINSHARQARTVRGEPTAFMSGQFHGVNIPQASFAADAACKPGQIRHFRPDNRPYWIAMEIFSPKMG